MAETTKKAITIGDQGAVRHTAGYFIILCYYTLSTEYKPVIHSCSISMSSSILDGKKKTKNSRKSIQ